MKIIIVEGIDGSGKTFLIENFRKRLGSNVPHPLFFDRGFHSKYVYGHLLNKVDDPSDIMFSFEKLNSIFSVYVVYLDVNPETACNRMRNKKFENFIYTKEQLARIKDYYKIAFEVMPCNLIRIDANKSIDECVNDLMEKIN
jgi:thymidylate kinase